MAAAIPPTADTSSSSPPAPPLTEPVDRLITTRHTLATGAGELRYTARTGRIVLREEDLDGGVFRGWRARGQLAVTAYTLDDADPATRPLTFVFNGGPGSASVWLHLGLAGPRRVEMVEPGATLPPPYALVDNPDTLLHATDLVFIDPMSTGQSRAVEGGRPGEFHGFAKDVEQIAELIRLWCTREDRWMSPKFLLGESYGTLRAVAVAERLSSAHRLALNGLVLVSSVLSYANQDFESARWDEACVHFLPTYAAVAHYHGVGAPGPLPEVLAEAEAFADGEYAAALRAGRRLDPARRAAVVAEVVRLTGLSEGYVDRADLRIEHMRFCAEVLRDRGLVVGRIDGRFTGPARSRVAELPDADPSMDALEGPYAAAIHHYLRAELGSDLDLPFAVYAAAAGEEWSYAEFDGRAVDVTDRLERVLRANPHLRVRVEYGRYDLATPYHAAEDTLAHLRLDDAAWDRLEHAYFDAGHMPYLDAACRAAESAGIVDFIRRACPAANPS